ncbi:MAG TPA: hypothetical protein VGC44_05360, partial [Longimicrobiales bacterium]
MRIPRWLPYAAIVAFYITVAVIARVWLQPVFARRYDFSRTSDMRRWSAIGERMRKENDALRLLVLRDSMERVLPRTPGLYISGFADTVKVLVSRRGTEPFFENVSLRTLAQKEAGATPRASINMMAVPVRYGTHPEIPESFRRRTILFGAVDGRPYCAVTVGTTGERLVREGPALTRDGTLGICAFWSRYGQPGRQIERWLSAGGAHFGKAESINGVEYRMDELVPAEFRVNRRFAMPLAGQACLAGREDVCARAVAQPDRIYGMPDLTWELDDWDIRLVAGEHTMLSKLEREFGAERFARFWNSNEPFEAAFQSA